MSASQFPPHLFGVYKNEMVSVSGGVLMLHAPPSYLFSESFVDVGVSPVTRNPPWEFGWTATQEKLKRWFVFFAESWPTRRGQIPVPFLGARDGHP